MEKILRIFIDFSEDKTHGLVSILDLHLEKNWDKIDEIKVQARASPELLRVESKTDPRNINK